MCRVLLLLLVAGTVPADCAEHYFMTGDWTVQSTPYYWLLETVQSTPISTEVTRLCRAVLLLLVNVQSPAAAAGYWDCTSRLCRALLYDWGLDCAEHSLLLVTGDCAEHPY